MLAKRIIPTLLYKQGLLVKGEGFKSDRVCGNALQAARIHAMRLVDELVMLDVSDDEPDYEMIRQLTDRSFTPVTVGGGIKTVADVQKLLNAGADKVCMTLHHHDLLKEVSDKFGSQCVMAALDVPDTHVETMESYEWTKRVTLRGASLLKKLGAGEILLQSRSRDGTMKGYDLEMIGAVSKAVNIPVVASGGCSGYRDMENAIKAGAHAVAAGALFLFTDATPLNAAKYLHSKGIEVRLT